MNETLTTDLVRGWTIEITINTEGYPPDWQDRLISKLNTGGWSTSRIWDPGSMQRFDRAGERYTTGFRGRDRVPGWVRLQEHHLPMYLEEIRNDLRSER